MKSFSKLKALASLATRGEWVAYTKGDTRAVGTKKSTDQIIHWTGFDSCHEEDSRRAHNARFIAAANPDAILELIGELERSTNRAVVKLPDRDQYCGEDYDQVYDQFVEALARAGLILQHVDND